MFQQIDPKYFMLKCKLIGRGLSYEDYLIEILNWSRHFRNKSKDKSEYKAPKSEAKGESDAYSSDYQIDFKLLVDEDIMRCLNMNKPTVNKSYIKQGVIIVNDNPSPTPVPMRNILADIMRISSQEIQEGTFSNSTMEHFIQYLKKEKNLFLYYPYEFIGDKLYPVGSFANLLTEIFRIPLGYRVSKNPDKETYICIKVNEHFLIFEWVENEFVYRDSVNELLCSKYQDYKLYSFF